MEETGSNSEVKEERKPHRTSDGPRAKEGKDGAKPEWAGGRFRRPRRKSCRFCADHVAAIDYKDFNRIRSFVSDRGKIIPSRMTGTCASHQRELTKAIKRARNIALLPFANN
jgi:small subunit ribosomal protein S18